MHTTTNTKAPHNKTERVREIVKLVFRHSTQRPQVEPFLGGQVAIGYHECVTRDHHMHLTLIETLVGYHGFTLQKMKRYTGITVYIVS